MHAIILAQASHFLKRIHVLNKGLIAENIRCETAVWDGEIREFPDANIIIIYGESLDEELLLAIPEFRRRLPSVPIVIAQTKENKETKKRIMDLGAHGYFAEPLVPRHFATRLKQLVAHHQYLSTTKWLRAFDVWLDLEQHFVKRSKRTFRLRNKEFSLLEFFIINRGKILTRNLILEHVWDRNANFASNTVDVHINRLRQKLDAPFSEKLIHTVPCIGYVFDKRKRLYSLRAAKNHSRHQ